MHFLKFVLVALLGVSFYSHANAELDDVVVLEKKSGHTNEFNISRSHYSQKIEKIMNSVNESVLPALEMREDPGSWKLKAVLVGIGLNVEAGLGPIISVAAKSRFQLIYTKNGTPYTP